MEKIYDLVIIGAGPAGMTAGIYANRARLDYVLLEKAFPGGQIINTYEVENYTGYSNISGFDLAQKMQEHLKYLGGSITTAEVQEVKVGENNIKEVVTSSGSYFTKTVIVATGATPRHLGVKGEAEFSGKGVSYCATCDGSFYRDKTTMVIGGGNVAVEDALYLSRVCNKVYIAHRRDEFRATKNLQDKLLETPNIEVLWFTEAEEIKGDDFVKSIKVFNNQTDEKREIELDGIFVAVGSKPNGEFMGDLVEKDARGNLVANANGETSVHNIYVAGDLKSGSVRQIMTACGDAVVAVMDIDKKI